MRSLTLIFLLNFVAKATSQWLIRASQPSPSSKALPQLPHRFPASGLPSRHSSISRAARRELPEAMLKFEFGEVGGEIIGRAIPESEWESGVRNLNPKGNKPNILLLRMKEAAQRQVGKVVSDEDMAQASTDLSNLDRGDIAAIKRSDGTWRYAKLIQEIDADLLATTTSSGISALMLISLTVIVGIGAALIVLSRRIGTAPPGKRPLLDA